MLLYLFCLKVYFGKSEQIDENKSMIQTVIELGKPEFSETLNAILGKNYYRSIENKENDDEVNDGKGNEGGEEKKKERNKENKHEEGKYYFYLTNSIKKFITDIVEKQNKTKRAYLTSSLYVLLGQNIFHHNLTAFAHDFGEEIKVGFFEFGYKKYIYGLRRRHIS